MCSFFTRSVFLPKELKQVSFGRFGGVKIVLESETFQMPHDQHLVTECEKQTFNDITSL